MGLLEALLGADNPAAQWANKNTNWLGSIGAGLGAPGSVADKLGAAAQYAPAGRAADASAQEKLTATNQTKAWLHAQGFDDLVPLVDAGQGTIALTTAIQRKTAAANGGQPDWQTFTDKAGNVMRYDNSLADPQVQSLYQPTPGTMKPEPQPGMQYAPSWRPGAPPSDTAQMPVPGSKEAFDREQSMGKDYRATDAVKTYETVRNGYEKVQSAAKLNTGAGDVSLIFAYMKMLDPTSVVREGEFATAQQTAGIPATVVNLYNQAVSGVRLNPEQRSEFIKAADQIYSDVSQNLSAQNQQWQQRARQWYVDPNNFLVQPEAYASGAVSDPLGIR